jgi:hypothetical protein
MRVLVGLAIASVMLAGGCRQSDETVKAELRTQIVERCSVANAPRAAEDPGFDAAKFCTCVSDQMIGNRSVAELRKLLETKEVAAEQGRQIGEGCFKQQSDPVMTAAAIEPGNAADGTAARAESRAESQAAPEARRIAKLPASRAPDRPANRPSREDVEQAKEEAAEEPAEATEDEAVEDSQ